MGGGRALLGIAGALVAGVLAAGCALSVGFEGSRYACEPPAGACPGGFVCAEDGFCLPESATGDPDADVPLLDAGADDGTALADAAVADAAPGPDGPPVDAGTGAPVTVSFGERTTSNVSGVTFDTYISSVNQAENKGGGTDISCTTDSDRTCLVRFDLSSIPTGAVVLAATLELWTNDDSSTSAARLIPVLEAWDEGNQVDANGFANWVFRQPGVAWSGEGATPPSRAAQFVAEFLPAQDQTPYPITLPNALVQGWVAAPTTNFGVAIVPVSNNSDFGLKASESSQDERRPQLTITYVP